MIHLVAFFFIILSGNVRNKLRRVRSTSTTINKSISIWSSLEIRGQHKHIPHTRAHVHAHISTRLSISRCTHSWWDHCFYFEASRVKNLNQSFINFAGVSRHNYRTFHTTRWRRIPPKRETILQLAAAVKAPPSLPDDPPATGSDPSLLQLHLQRKSATWEYYTTVSR